MAFKRRSRFNNTKVEYLGIKFDSKLEMNRYKVLKSFEDAGEISDLKVHVKFSLVLHDGTELVIKGPKRNNRCSYTCDFTFIKDDLLVIEDTKSRITASEYSFKVKRALFEALYGININLIFNINTPPGVGER